MLRRMEKTDESFNLVRQAVEGVGRVSRTVPCFCVVDRQGMDPYTVERNIRPEVLNVTQGAQLLNRGCFEPGLVRTGVNLCARSEGEQDAEYARSQAVDASEDAPSPSHRNQLTEVMESSGFLASE